MLNRVLGNHSQVIALNELHYFGDIWKPGAGVSLSTKELEGMAAQLIARYYRGIWGGLFTDEDRKQAIEIVSKLRPEQKNGWAIFSAVMEWISEVQGKNCISEQTPRNIFYASALLDNYPDSYVVQMVRDPRAVLASQKGRWRRKWLGGDNIPWLEIVRVRANYHPITMCKLWKKAIHASIALSEHPRFTALCFESLVASPEKELVELCSFLGLSYEPDMDNVPLVGSSNKKNHDNRKGISSDVLDTWKNKLSSGEIALCEYICRNEMAYYGYKPVTNNIPLISVLMNLIFFPVHLVGVVITNPKRAMIQLRAYLRK